MTGIEPKYPRNLRILHWTMALGFLLLFVTGPVMVGLDREDSLRADLFALHKSVGVLSLLAAAVRLHVRRRAVLPDFPERLQAWEAALAPLVHRVLHAGMLLVPLTGWAVSDLHGRGVKLFALPLPRLLPTVEGVGAWPDLVHTVAAYTLLGVVALHLAGVVKHRFWDRIPILERML